MYIYYALLCIIIIYILLYSIIKYLIVEINAYRACIEEEAERIKAAKYGPKKKGDFF